LSRILKFYIRLFWMAHGWFLENSFNVASLLVTVGPQL